MSVGQNLILPFIFFYLPAAVSQTRLWLSAFPLFGSSCPPLKDFRNHALPARRSRSGARRPRMLFGVFDQPVAEGPEHEGEQADRGDVG